MIEKVTFVYSILFVFPKVTYIFLLPCLVNLHEFQSKSEAEKEIVEILQKALSYCDLNKDNSKHLLYQFRAATIHYRLASIYHSHIWNDTCTDLNRKATIQLARLNYEKSAKFYLESADVLKYLTAQMQRVALGEYIAECKYVLMRIHVKCNVRNVAIEDFGCFLVLQIKTCFSDMCFAIYSISCSSN